MEKKSVSLSEYQRKQLSGALHDLTHPRHVFAGGIKPLDVF